MVKEKEVILRATNDYAQSANTLFNFMDRFVYLETILQTKAIIPRYCIEDIEYLGIETKEVKFKKIAVLQKCFCDLSIVNLTKKFYLKGIGEEYDLLSSEEKENVSKNNTHPKFYGEFAIGLSKVWGEENKLHPIHYINEKSTYIKEYRELFNIFIEDDNIKDEYIKDILNRISFMKPIRGIMGRSIMREGIDSYTTINFLKNFHDEKEWRYVPNISQLSEKGLDNIIANPNILDNKEYIKEINENLEKDSYNTLWLKYKYEDIKYIIVPDSKSRNDIINTIINIPKGNFEDQIDIMAQKHLLISKIIVLEQLEEDW